MPAAASFSSGGPGSGTNGGGGGGGGGGRSKIPVGWLTIVLLQSALFVLYYLSQQGSSSESTRSCPVPADTWRALGNDQQQPPQPQQDSGSNGAAPSSDSSGKTWLEEPGWVWRLPVQGRDYPQQWYDCSYVMPAFWPLRSFRLVMENVPGTCDVFTNRPVAKNVCTMMRDKQHFEPEPHVYEVFASVLSDCDRRPAGEQCHTLDIGANAGYMGGYMASMGATVLAVEPQLDLWGTFNKSISVNGWEGRVKALHGYVSVNAEDRGKSMENSKGYRPPGPGGIKQPPLSQAPFYVLEDLMTDAEVVKNWTLAKVDTDSIDGPILRSMIEMLRAGRVNIETIVTEFSKGEPDIVWTFQQELGYDVYRLDIHDDRRFFDQYGHDVYSNFGPIGLRGGLDERFFQRAIRHIFYIKPEKGLEVWKHGLVAPFRAHLTNGAFTQFLITKVDLTEPRWEHPQALLNPSPERQRSGYQPPSQD